VHYLHKLPRSTSQVEFKHSRCHAAWIRYLFKHGAHKAVLELLVLQHQVNLVVREVLVDTLKVGLWLILVTCSTFSLAVKELLQLADSMAVLMADQQMQVVAVVRLTSVSTEQQNQTV
jgi:hypothetical protein